MTRSKPNSCIGCSLHDHGSDFSQPEGTGSLGLLIIGEASGDAEQRDQLPFRPYAAAGSLLERTFRRMGLDRKQMAISNVGRCRPRNNWLDGAPYEYAALRHCRPNLHDVLRKYRPRCLMALGNIALRELTGRTGEAQGVGHMTGYCLPSSPDLTDALWGGPGNPIPTVAAMHPAYIRRGKASHQGLFSRNLARAVNVASGKDRSWIWDLEEAQRDGRLRYQTHPSLDEANSFLRRVQAGSGIALSYDIETYESASIDEDARDGFTDTRIRLIQFSCEAGTGMALPWEGSYRTIAQSLLHTSGVKCGHHIWNFDNKVLRACGEREGLDLMPRGVLRDTLAMFHHWQPDLPAHLQFACQFIQSPFPWKHLASTDLEFYGVCDADNTLQLHNFLVETLRRDGIWNGDVDGQPCLGYVGQVEAIRPILAGMEDLGFPVDNAERLKLDGAFKQAGIELAQELMPRFPESAKKLDPYKTFPPELKKLPEDEWGKLFQEPDKLDKRGRIRAGKWYRYGQREVPAPAIVDGEPVIQLAMRWCYIPEFNPNSGKQLIEYMKSQGHKVPKSKETDDEGNEKDTTNKKELVRLAHRHGDNFYLKTIEYRELSKLRGTYIDGFRPHEDGCVHTMFSYQTGIGQLASHNPSILNFPKHGRLAKEIRRMIAAKPGNVLVEWDYKSCHVVTLGFLAEDSNYLRCARIDMHSLVTGHKLGLWNLPVILRDESDAQLKARCKWLKANPEWKHIRDARMKHCIAEGELVLTDQGLVPIQNITLAHRLWDGIEFVSHAGLIDQGVQEVMTYEGLTATPDHEVFTEDGRTISLWQAASSLARLHATGIAGSPVRTCYRDLIEAEAKKWLHRASLPMHQVWKEEVDRQVESHARRQQRLSVMLADEIEAPKSTRAQVRRHHRSMQQEAQPELQGLRRSWDRMPIHLSGTICEMDRGESASRELHWDRDRPQGQQWPLRAWELASHQSAWPDEEYASESVDDVSRPANLGLRVRQPLWPIVDGSFGAARADWRADYRERQGSFPKGHEQGVEGNGSVARRARVYDIADAGLRHCFTVSGKLVHNCLLGIGNGLKARGLFEKHMEDFSGQKEAAEFLAVAEALFPKVFEWQKKVQKQAHEQQFLKTQYGHIRRFYEVFRWDTKKGGWGHGDQAEEAISYWLSNIAFGYIREHMLALHHVGLDAKYGLCNNVHDSLIFMFPESMVEEHVKEIYPMLVAPSKVLFHPTIAPNGLSIDAEANIGRNWSEMRELPIEQSVEAQDARNAILGKSRSVVGIGA